MEQDRELIALGQRIKTLRRQKGMQQQQLAEACGFSKSQMTNIENGWKNIQYTTQKRIARALQMSVSEMLQGL